MSCNHTTRSIASAAAAALLGAFVVMGGAPEAKAAELSGFGACQVKLPPQIAAAAECATLTVLENPAKPNGRRLQLPLLKIRSTSKTPGTPLFVLKGGPGAANVGRVVPTGDAGRDRDIYYLGYRGADGADVFDCPEVDAIFPAAGLLTDQTLDKQGAASKACAQRLRKAGYDLSHYSMLDVIADLETARSALGLQKIDLLSVSYGTRVAQLYARQHPDRIERSVLAGANPPGHFVFSAYVNDKVVRRIAELCSSDPACAGKSPDLRRTILNALSLGERGKSQSIDDGKTHLALFEGLYSRSGAVAFVKAAQAAEAGDTRALEAMGVEAATSLKDVIWGDLLAKGAVDAYRYPDMQRTFRSTSESMGSPLDMIYYAVARGWPKASLPAEFARADFDDTETLVVNGDLDVATPLLFIEAELMPRLRHGQLIALKDYGHGDFGRLGPALGRMVGDFLRSGALDRPAFPADPYSFE